MSTSSRRYLSVWLKRLSTDRIERRSVMPADSALVVVEPVKAALRISALNKAAARLGLTRGLPLADARARYPSLTVVEADRQADHALLEAIADWCDRYTPLVGLDTPHGLLLDISGCVHLFGGERALCDDMHGRLARQGMTVALALADTPGCAWAVARYGRTMIVPKEGVRNAMLPLPLASLRLDSDTVLSLAKVGLEAVADIIDRPRAVLAARFGADLIRRLDQALGGEDTVITPRLPLPSYVAERRFPEPVARENDVLGTIGFLAHELSRLLERNGQGARLIQVALFRVDGKVYRLDVGTGVPLRDPARIRRLFSERLAVLADECDSGFGYDMVRLSALVCERLDAVQTGLASDDHHIELAHLVDRLSARFGSRRLTRLVPRDTHIPEYAIEAVPAQSIKSAVAANTIENDSSFQDSLAPVRPIRLFNQPEAIRTIAEIPDGPPVRFQWRHKLYEIVAVEGPERIAMEWWRDAGGLALARDYFRIESKEGIRAWLFREGLYGCEHSRPQWFLHGLFA